MARIAEIHKRLIRWQEWYFTSQACGIRSPRMTPPVDRAPRLGGFIAFDESEALATDAAVATLPEDLREIVKTVYLDPEQRPMTVTASILRISRNTLYRKLEMSDRLLFERLQKTLSDREK